MKKANSVDLLLVVLPLAAPRSKYRSHRLRPKTCLYIFLRPFKTPPRRRSENRCVRKANIQAICVLSVDLDQSRHTFRRTRIESSDCTSCPTKLGHAFSRAARAGDLGRTHVRKTPKKPLSRKNREWRHLSKRRATPLAWLQASSKKLSSPRSRMRRVSLLQTAESKSPQLDQRQRPPRESCAIRMARVCYSMSGTSVA